MADYSANPSWPAEFRALASPWPRLAMRHFLLLSALLHAMAFLLKFDFWPVFPVDRSMLDSQKRQSLRLYLQPLPSRPSVLTPSSAENLLTRAQRQQRNADRSQTQPARTPHAATRTSANPPESRIPPAQPLNAISEDAQTLIARGKAMLDTDSRRITADPMAQARFAAPAKAVKQTPFEQASAVRAQVVEQFDGKLIRVTTASGKRYCLQALPEVVTRDMPSPVLSVPSNCP